MKQKTRWTAAYAMKALDEADKAKSDNAYAVKAGINGQRISWWRKQLGHPRPAAGRKDSRTKAAFVEVVAGRPTASASVEIMLANGRQFRVSDQIDAGVLGRIADALDPRC